MTFLAKTSCTEGTHILAEFAECSPEVLDNPKQVEALLTAAAEAAGATIVAKVFHQFRPQGVTGVVVVEESHISIHTWPELGYASCDFYTCGDCDPKRAFALLARGLGAQSTELIEVKRGLSGPLRMQVKGHKPVQTITVDCRPDALPDSVTAGFSPHRGMGLFAARPIAAGEIIYTMPGRFADWTSEVELVTEWGTSVLAADDAGYEIGLDVVGQWSEAVLGAIARHHGVKAADLARLRACLTRQNTAGLLAGFDMLVNHSRDSNCLIDWAAAEITFDGREPVLCLFLRALKPIAEGEELFKDYAQGDEDYAPPEGWV